MRRKRNDGGHILHACNDPDCFVCRGGLALCTVCNGAEGSLPTDCPGRRMSAWEADEVQASRLDYRGGIWVRPGGAWVELPVRKSDANPSGSR